MNVKKKKEMQDFPLFHHGGALAAGGLVQPKALSALLRSESRGSSSQFNVDGDRERGASTKGVDEERNGR
jgi:hypothetical protein